MKTITGPWWTGWSGLVELVCREEIGCVRGRKAWEIRLCCIKGLSELPKLSSIVWIDVENGRRWCRLYVDGSSQWVWADRCWNFCKMGPRSSEIWTLILVKLLPLKTVKEQWLQMGKVLFLYRLRSDRTFSQKILQTSTWSDLWLVVFLIRLHVSANQNTRKFVAKNTASAKFEDLVLYAKIVGNRSK